jgi:hypothetical protein
VLSFTFGDSVLDLIIKLLGVAVHFDFVIPFPEWADVLHFIKTPKISEPLDSRNVVLDFEKTGLIPENLWDLPCSFLSMRLIPRDG